MEARLDRKPINFYKNLFNTSMTHEETMEMIVPDAMPDILRIVDTDGTVMLRSKEAENGKATIGGAIVTTVLYMPEGEERVKKLELKIPFTSFCESPAIDKNTRLVANASLCSIDSRSLNPRKILVRADVLTQISGYSPSKAELCTAPEDSTVDIEVLEQRRDVNIVSDVREKTFVVSDDFTLPSSKPQVNEILKSEVAITSDDTKTVGNKLIMKGTVNVNILYAAKGGDGPYSAEFSVPFSQIAEIEASESPEFNVAFMPTAVYFDIVDNGDGGTMITMELHAVAQFTVMEQRTIEYISDLYSTVFETNHEMENFSIDAVEKTSVVREMIRTTIETSVQPRNIVGIRAFTGRVNTMDTREGCQLETTVTLSVLYIAEDGRLLSQTERMKVSSNWEAPCENVKYVAAAVCNDIYAAPAPNGVDIRFNVDFTVTANKSQNIEMVNSISYDENNKKDLSAYPSVTVKRTMPNDNLWELAKRYNSTQALIAEANALESPNLEYGQLLIIPKKR
ncbi:MAG TPA: DUF3794 domain-containing protein [Clostridiales bacterium]|nr:DUF3794 domain-containing protein [Clostridiales bacterium]